MDLSVLNDRQREAVESTEGRIRIIAGAGSGKTRTLAYRYAYIVNELGVSPANILCLTFTNKAAQEMRSRISGLVPPGFTNDFVCTIHGFCVKFLREEIHLIGYPKNFRILDEEDMKYLARRVLAENDVVRSAKTVRELLENLFSFKILTPEYIYHYMTEGVKTADIRHESLEVQLFMKQRDNLSLDFNDLLFFTLHILNTYEDVKRKWQERMNYVMVDETQDCNRTDWKLINLLAWQCNNLFVVGDPDQAIYEWRGAVPKSFLEFYSYKDIVLDENYRSTPEILNTANAVIVNNQNRIKKDMFTKNDSGDKLIYFHAANDNEEADWICSEIIKRVEEGSRFSDFAILFRSSHQSRLIEQNFIRKGIPYTLWGGVRFFERAEIKDCISYLVLIDNDDDIAFERIINMPSRKVGKKTLELIRNLADKDACSMYMALKNNLGYPRLAKPELKDFVEVIDSLRAQKHSMKISAIMSSVLENSGLMDAYRGDNDEERLENIVELINSVRLYEEGLDEDEAGLDVYLQEIALYTNADYRKESNKVKMMTIHQSKGLEFPYVFVIGLNEGIFPNARSIRERKLPGLEEERRLMYVAVTRAEKCLFMTESEGYSVHTQQEKLPSRFIAEIPRNMLEIRGQMDENLWIKLKCKVHWEELIDLNEGYEDIGKGTTVRHKVFGMGTVVEVQESGICKVNFEKGFVRFLRKEVLEYL